MLVDLSAFAFCALMAILALFQLALAFGAPFGRFAWGGAHERLPSALRIGSLLSIAIYAVMSAIVLDRADLALVFPDIAIAEVGIWLVAGYMALGVVMNAISRSKPERFAMTPLAAVLCGLAVVAALSPPALAAQA